MPKSDLPRIKPAPLNVDMAKAVPVDGWKADPDPAKVRIVIDDGGKEVIISFEVNIVGVMRVGNNPTTGEPIYNVGTTNVLKSLKWDKSLKSVPDSVPSSSPPPDRGYA